MFLFLFRSFVITRWPVRLLLQVFGIVFSIGVSSLIGYQINLAWKQFVPGIILSERKKRKNSKVLKLISTVHGCFSLIPLPIVFCTFDFFSAVKQFYVAPLHINNRFCKINLMFLNMVSEFFVFNYSQGIFSVKIFCITKAYYINLVNRDRSRNILISVDLELVTYFRIIIIKPLIQYTDSGTQRFSSITSV